MSRLMLAILLALMLVPTVPAQTPPKSEKSAPAPAQEKSDQIESLTAWIRLNPQDALAYKMRGIAWGPRANWDLAIKDFDESLRLDPVQADVYRLKAIARYEQRDYKKAVYDLESALYINPQDGEAYLYRGMSYLAMANADLGAGIGGTDSAKKYADAAKEFGSAIDDLEEALRHGPTMVGVDALIECARQGKKAAKTLGNAKQAPAGPNAAQPLWAPQPAAVPSSGEKAADNEIKVSVNLKADIKITITRVMIEPCCAPPVFLKPMPPAK